MKFNKFHKSIMLGTWLNFKEKADLEWFNYFQRLYDGGIKEYFINGNKNQIEYLIDLTKEFEINIHGWVWTLNRPEDAIAIKNPDWYSVNRNGDNSYECRPYVDYYQWLSPFSNGARCHVKENIQYISKIDGIASVHLDYVRYCDIFLPKNLQKFYRITQKYEMPEFDFGYHRNAREGFKKLHGIDPINIENNIQKKQWNQYRLDAVTSLVNELKIITKENNTNISAAVFPYPDMSKKMVRQDWSNWELDMVCPMNYHHFYNGDLDWIKESVLKGIKSKWPKSKYLSGLYVGALSPTELKVAIKKCLDAGADGISFFSADTITDEHIKVLKSLK